MQEVLLLGSGAMAECMVVQHDSAGVKGDGRVHMMHMQLMDCAG
jgi:hypothetical protein